MSWAEDMGYDAYDGDCFRNKKLEKIENRLRKGKWKTADGVKINITDMETQHILNCMNKLRGKIDLFMFE